MTTLSSSPLAVAEPARALMAFRAPLWLPGARPLRRVEVMTQGLTLTLRGFSKREVSLRWSDLRALQLVQLRGRTLLLIETVTSQFVLMSTQTNDTALRRVRDTAREALAAEPHASDLIARSEAQELATSAVLARAVPVTWALAIMNALLFGVQSALHLVGNPLKLVAAGGNAPLLVAQGEYDRLLTASFLHGGGWHVYVNILALVAVGSTLERLLGSARFLIVGLVAGIGGQVASTLGGRALVSVGASGMIFGLLGGMAMLHLSSPPLPMALRARPQWWASVLGINAALSIFFPMIDWVAHLGGTAVGALLTWAVVAGRRGPQRFSVGVTVLATLLVGVHLAAGVAAVSRARNDPRTSLLTALLGAVHPKGELTNELAWQIAIDPTATAAQVELGCRVARRTLQVGHISQIAEAEDTLAEIEYRLGHLDEAVRLETSAMRRAPKAFFATQLARFGLARVAKQGSPLGRAPGDPIGPVELERTKLETGAGLRVAFQRVAGSAMPMLIYAASVDEEDKLTGVALLCAGPSSHAIAEFPATAHSPAIAARLIPIAVDAGACADPAPAVMTLTSFLVDKAALVLP